jgi:hypothetical protein
VKLLQKAGKIKEDYLGLIKLAIKKSGDEKESCHFFGGLQNHFR